jgi:hypothetical protein
MTEKAQAVLQKMKFRRLFPSRSPQPANEQASTAGSDQGMAVLNDSNELQSGHDEFVRSLASGVDVMK